jgi:hypothetical protein
MGHPDSAVRTQGSGERPDPYERMPFQNQAPAADTSCMTLRTSTLDRIAGSFADAVAAGDFEAAEGWMATARYVERREEDMRPVTAARRLRPSRRILFRIAG